MLWFFFTFWVGGGGGVFSLYEAQRSPDSFSMNPMALLLPVCFVLDIVKWKMNKTDRLRLWSVELKF